MSLSVLQIGFALVGLGALAYGIKQAFTSKNPVVAVDTNPNDSAADVSPPLKGPGSNTHLPPGVNQP